MDSPLEIWGPNLRGNENGVMIMLQPNEGVTFMQNSKLSYKYCVHGNGIVSVFSYVPSLRTLAALM
jgi:hypothetical protein